MLLPCPFCGNEEPGIRIRRFENPTFALVECCHCEASISAQECPTEEEAIVRWNTRVSPT